VTVCRRRCASDTHAELLLRGDHWSIEHRVTIQNRRSSNLKVLWSTIEFEVVARVLVLGGSGLVGRFLIPRLVEAGYVVVAPSRNPPRRLDCPGVQWVTLDLGQAEAINELPESDVVVSMMPIWITAKLCAAMNSARPLRVIAFSSTSAVTKSDSVDENERQFSNLLLSGEADLLALAPRVTSTLFRPTMIYGGPGDRNVSRVAAQLRSFRLFPLVARGVGLRQPVHADDLAAAIVQALAASASEGRTYDLSGSEVLSFRSMVERIGTAIGARPIFVSIPLSVARTALTAVSMVPRLREIPRESVARMGKDMVFDHGLAKQDFGFTPRGFEPTGDQ